MTLSPQEELDRLAAENLQLREVINRSTTELEHKNRELEIEAALERVRAIAMSMQEPNGMLDICKMISDQLCQLGVKEIRNIQTAIIYAAKGTYLNFEYYTKHNRSFITEVHYDNHQMSIDFVQQMLMDPDGFFTHSLNGDELRAWYAFQKTTNQFADDFLANADSLNYYWHSAGPVALGISTYYPLQPQEIELFKRFRNVFGLAYRRYLDIEKALAQAREARIELALERVRARTMAMQRSEEMVEASHVLFNELHALGIETIRTGVATVDAEQETVTVWSSQLVEKNDNKILGVVPRKAHAFFDGYYEAWKKKDPFFTYSMSGDEVRSYYTTMSSILSYPLQSEFNSKETFQVFFFPEGSLNVITHEPLPEESCQLLIRFARVFGLIYRRFLDLKQAEAQAQEARIEASLERVRAVAMSMHMSDDLLNVCEVLFHELGSLGFNNIRNAIIDIYDDEKKWKLNYDYSDVMGKAIAHVPYDIHPFIQKQIKEIRSAEDAFSETVFAGEELEGWKEFRRKSGQQDDPRVTSSSTLHYYFYSINKGAIGISTFGNIDAMQVELLKRFRNVFNLSYQRYTDIVLAEAQAREARIELALERVRARTMAMQRSEELSETAQILFQQFKVLGENPIQITIGIINEEAGVIDFNVTDWSGEGNQIARTFTAEITEPSLMQKIYTAWKANQKSVVVELTGQELLDWVAYRNKWSGTTDNQFQLHHRRTVHAGFFSKGLISFSTHDPRPAETINVLERFAGVFDQTYTRFLDLQKAEAQTREAQIEAALEKVRSRSLAVHKSEEFKEVINIVFEKLEDLGLKVDTASINIFIEGSKDTDVYACGHNENGLDIRKARLRYFDHPIANDLYNVHKNGLDFFVGSYGKEEKNSYYTYQFEHGDLKELPDEIKERILQTEHYSLSMAPAKHSIIILNNIDGKLLSETEIDIVKRFARVFEQAYTRFLDLQKSEAQARESQIEVALERVRSRTLAMQKSDELAETAAVLFQQLISLGIEPNRLYITIIKDEEANAEFWITDEDGSKVSSAFETNLNNNPVFIKMLNGWNQKKDSLMIDLKGKELQDYFQYLSSLHVPFKGGLTQTRRIQYIGYFNKGFIGMASPDEQPEETVQLLVRFAAVFNLTFTRFNDLKIAEHHAEQAREDLIKLQIEKKRAEEALTELRATQAQLIQSEKMASLGELTAGIAHEIQNPLNFVNNFSEVNAELIDELNEELATGNVQLAKEIAGNIKDNEEKIVFHGKRADAIVKGMLQHSRRSTGVKEPTDINALADEYLRLAYHGLRAKDKTFNATMKTDFDPNIGLVNVIPQDIGRVILNLITNAFYAVNNSSSNPTVALSPPLPPVGGKKYEPTVTVTTKRHLPPTGGKGGEEASVEICVADNGPGIPKNILDKIFQPFFTTKPTGQGTGLGLSLSYDIIKAHGGELKVETMEGEGTEFIIVLPAT